MSLDTTEAIYKEYRFTTREYLTKHLKHDGDWKHFNEIEQTTEERIAQEKQDWQESYYTRLADARQIILREVHGNILEPPKPEGIKAIPNRQVLDVKADQRIRQDHQRRLSAIRQDELDQYEEFRRVLKKRAPMKDQARAEFEKVRTRSGPSSS